MKTYSVLFLFFFTLFQGAAQKDSFFAEMNYNTFSHNSLNGFLVDYLSNLESPNGTVTDDFPGNSGYTIGYSSAYLNMNFFYSYINTGGKANYKDFSGSRSFTMPLKGNTFGMSYPLPVFKKYTNNKLHIDIRGLFTYTRAEVEVVREYNIRYTEEPSYYSYNFGIGANLNYELPISFFRLRASIGYDQYMGRRLKFHQSSDSNLEYFNGEAVRVQWSGIRTGIGIAISL